MKIVHFSAECYPVAKTGGLGDVVGALPKYLNKIKDINSLVVMPYVNNSYVRTNKFDEVYSFTMPHGPNNLSVSILKNYSLDYSLYLLKIEGFTHREHVYGYDDDAYYFTAFQTAALMWIQEWNELPDIVHCHDFHTGYIPFMMQYAHQFDKLRDIPSIFTIHNGEYQGQMSWSVVSTFPWFDINYSTLLEWDNTPNAMASAIKCAWVVTTVSPQYMQELTNSDSSLAPLFQQESAKCRGILNGIDIDEWNPRTDTHINYNYTARNVLKGKHSNKEELCALFGFNEDYPLIAFIGRFAEQKGVDVLADAIWRNINEFNHKMNFLIVGSGDQNLANRLEELKNHTKGMFNCYIGYNDSLAHKVYAGADFLVMPSRFEPCGLNQMYALRYGTVPIVRTVGGLIDSITDINDKGGVGIRFIWLNTDDLLHAFYRAGELHNASMTKLRKFIMKQDFSWDKSAKEYIELYKKCYE